MENKVSGKMINYEICNDYEKLAVIAQIDWTAFQLSQVD